MIKEVTVCVNNIDKQAFAVVAACKFAEKYGAVLRASYIKLDTVEIVRWAGSSPMDLANKLLADQDDREQNAKALFESFTKKFHCDKEWVCINQSGNPLKQMLCTDLFFVDQPTGDDHSFVGEDAFISNLILETNRPVVMIPHGWQSDELGSRILIGWNASPQAMRAVHDAMPILQHAKQVSILDVMKDSTFSTPTNTASKLQQYLGDRDIEAQLFIEHAGRQNAEETILTDYAKDCLVNLLVVGGYGHSKLRESVLGGMTQHLIENSEIPVLFSH